MTRAEIVAAAQSWIGCPYRHKGRSRAGIDCIGLLVMIGRQFGVPHRDHPDYANYPGDDRQILAELDAVLEIAQPDTPWVGSIGLFAEQRLPCHCGIFTERHGVLHLTHAAIKRRMVIEEPFDRGQPNQPWRLVRRYQFPGLGA